MLESILRACRSIPYAILAAWMVGEVGLEPTKAKPADLQSAPFATRDIPPSRARGYRAIGTVLSTPQSTSDHIARACRLLRCLRRPSAICGARQYPCSRNVAQNAGG